ncbi:MAG: 3-hydroxyacyl-CoA dehydrogenase family protein [Planctomycetaceae bacterium]|nr:3-hydroxyacyl-CoA dehydrogenase family protein [Planctomycetaceae bacterium]
MEIDRVGIIGAGMMGVAIAAANLRVGLRVLLYDKSSEVLSNVSKRIADELKVQEIQYDPQLVEITDRLESVIGLSVIIETIPEKLRIKHKLYYDLQRLIKIQTGLSAGLSALLLSNTSTISIASLAKSLSFDWRLRFCGFHFFHPIRSRSLVEIVEGQETSRETIEFARSYAKRLGKQSIVVKDGVGFLVNRILNAYLISALRLFEFGVSMERIERVAIEFGMKMGPFRIMDEIGLDVVLHAGWVLWKAFPDKTFNSEILVNLVESRRLGRKTGRGFMIYNSTTQWEGEGIPDNEIIVTKNKSENKNFTDDQIIKILFGNMQEEALRCFEDGIITNLTDIDTALVLALGFPQSKGGITQMRF